MTTAVERILLLDVDGVLNTHRQHTNGFCGLDPDKLERLDRIVHTTGCRIVLASAWRYMILRGEMTLKGFGHLLATHGATGTVIAALCYYLPADGSVNDLHDRGKLARAWLDYHREMATQGLFPRIGAFAALDDGNIDGLDLGYEVMGIPSVRPDGRVGLTDADADEVIRLLMEPAR